MSDNAWLRQSGIPHLSLVFTPITLLRVDQDRFARDPFVCGPKNNEVAQFEAARNRHGKTRTAIFPRSRFKEPEFAIQR